MQKVIRLADIREYAEQLAPRVIDYISDGQIETFESFDTFDLIAFDWYDLRDAEQPPAQILIYMDADDVFCICENERAYAVAAPLFEAAASNEQAVWQFFHRLLRGSAKQLEQFEGEVALLDEDVADGTEPGLRERLMDMRNVLLRVKTYYEQMEFLFEEICDNDNALISSGSLKYFEVLRNRSVRLSAHARNLWEYITQVRESYQSQIGIEQNELMKVFTLVTSIFLPLSLIAGWYGMNVQMPEFAWKHGYLFVIGLCAAVSIVWYVIFKHKRWFK